MAVIIHNSGSAKHRRLAVPILLLASAIHAHDIPNDVTVQAFLKPQGNTMSLIVRVPLRAMRDINFPERPGGFIDIDATDSLLPDAATLWISGFIDVYEGAAKLPRPRVVSTRLSLMSDRSFTSYDTAFAHVTGPKLAEDTAVVWDQTMFDVLFEYPIQSDRSEFSIQPRLARLGQHVVTVLRFLLLMVRSGLSNILATPAWFIWIRAGIRPRCGLSISGSTISWMARIICCSCSAW